MQHTTFAVQRLKEQLLGSDFMYHEMFSIRMLYRSRLRLVELNIAPGCSGTYIMTPVKH